MASVNELSDQEIGRRLRVARENANKSQEDAARAVGKSQVSIDSIERGRCASGIVEIQNLAHFYGRSVNAIIRGSAVHVSLIPRFRRLNKSPSESVIKAANVLNNLVCAEVELESILGIERKINYPEVKATNAGDIEALGNKHAAELRQWLGVASGPVSDIFSLIERNIGIRLYQRKLSTSISGLFVYDPAVGACILLNTSHSLRSRRYTAAHELGHFIGTRNSPESFERSESFESVEERYADYFGQSFLAPQDCFSKAFHSLSEGYDRPSRKLVIMLANKFGVSLKFCVHRLEHLGLVKRGIWDWFLASGGITKKQVKEVLGDAISENDFARDDSEQPIPHRIGLMAWRAWDRDLLSEGQLSELLCLDRVSLRKFLDMKHLEENTIDDILKLSVR